MGKLSDAAWKIPKRPLAPCRCGHPGAGCSCYEERVAEAGWKSPSNVGQAKVTFPAPVNLGPKRRVEEAILPGGCGTNPFVPIEELGLEADAIDRNTCQACGATIKIMVFRGTGCCSTRCRSAS